MREPLYRRLDRSKLIRWLVILLPVLLWLRNAFFSLLAGEYSDPYTGRHAILGEALQLALWLSVAALVWLMLLAPRLDPLRRAGTLSRAMRMFLAANRAYPADAAVMPETAAALESAQILAPTGVPRTHVPVVYYVDSDRIDACVVSGRGCQYIIMTTAMASALTRTEQTAVIVRLLVSVVDSVDEHVAATLGAFGLGTAHERDLRALLLLRDPEPLREAMLKTARNGLTEAAYGRIETVTSDASPIGEDKRLLAAVTSSGSISGQRWMGIEGDAAARIGFVSWNESPGCLSRARLLAEVSETDAAAVPAGPSAHVAAAPAAAVAMAAGRVPELSTARAHGPIVLIAPDSKVCPSCGAEREHDDEYCWLCYGVFVSPGQDPVPAPVEPTVETSATLAEEPALPRADVDAHPQSPPGRPVARSRSRATPEALRRRFRTATAVLATITMSVVVVSSVLVIGVSSWVVTHPALGEHEGPRASFWILEDASEEDVESLFATIDAQPGVVSRTRSDGWLTPPPSAAQHNGYVEVVFSLDSGSHEVEALYTTIESHPAFARVVDDTSGRWSASVDHERRRSRHPIYPGQIAVFLLGFLTVLAIPDSPSRVLAAVAAGLAGAPLAFSANVVVDWGEPWVELLTTQFVSVSWLSAGLMSMCLFALGLAGAAARLGKRMTARA